MRTLFATITCLFFIPTTNSVNVLFFLLGTNAFDRHIFEFVAQQIALRHHNVITVKPILVPEEPRLVRPRLHLVREKVIKNLLPSALYTPIEEVGKDIPWRKEYEVEAWDEPYWKGHNDSCYKMLNSNLMDTLKRDQVEVAVVYAGNPCQLAIVHVLAIPFLYYDLEGLTDETVVASGAPWTLRAPSSRATPRVPAAGLTGQLFTGLQLARETLCQAGLPYLGGMLCRRVSQLDDPITHIFREDYEIKKRFKKFPHVNQIKQSAELYLANTDPLLELQQFWPSHLVPVGGAHIDIPKPLFYPWNVSIASAPEGLIVVQMGSNVDGSKMPKHMMQSFVNVFSALTKYRIYWRVGTVLDLDGIDIESLPSHINVTTYVPQNDLLAHRRCRLFITNGGSSSIMESLTYGVPILGIPLYGVNHQNMVKVQAKGVGLELTKDSITDQSLLKAMRTLLESPVYKKNAEQFSKELRSRPSTGFQVLLSAIESVGRNRGAKFVRSFTKDSGLRLFLHTTSLHFYLALLAFAFFAGYTFIVLLQFCARFVLSAFLYKTPKKSAQKLKRH